MAIRGVGCRRLTHPCASGAPKGPDRLACLIHAANVHSEPGSNPSSVVDSPSRARPIPQEGLRSLTWSPRRSLAAGHESAPPARPQACRPRRPTLASLKGSRLLSTGLSKMPPRSRLAGPAASPAVSPAGRPEPTPLLRPAGRLVRPNFFSGHAGRTDPYHTPPTATWFGRAEARPRRAGRVDLRITRGATAWFAAPRRAGGAPQGSARRVGRGRPP